MNTGLDLVGVWSLIAHLNTDADGRALPRTYGPEGVGLIQFCTSGRMMVMLADGRALVPEEDRGRFYSSYTGIYSFDGTTLVVDVDAATDPERVGGQQIRGVRYESGVLSLFPPPIEIDGVLNHRELTWRRIAGASAPPALQA